MLWGAFANCEGVCFMLRNVLLQLIAGNLDRLREMILSIPDHICNKHEFLSNIQYKNCPHKPLGPRSKAWLDKNDLVSMESCLN